MFANVLCLSTKILLLFVKCFYILDFGTYSIACSKTMNKYFAETNKNHIDVWCS